MVRRDLSWISNSLLRGCIVVVWEREIACDSRFVRRCEDGDAGQSMHADKVYVPTSDMVKGSWENPIKEIN